MITNRAYLLAVLVAFSTLNQLDRQLMAILLEPIRREFVLSDVQLGLLSGLSFALFYAALSIPAAVWAVRRSRRNLIAAAAAVWGVATVFVGFAQSFWQLLVGRIGTGIGEAGSMPASHSMISDLYEPHERAGAMALWTVGINLGIFFAFLVGGYVGHRFGWRVPFIAAGLITILVALLTRFGIAEPARTGNAHSEALRQGPSVTLLREAVATMWLDSAIRYTVCGAVTMAVVG
ncbi:MAG: MFS transporter [Pseudolabrys sp.]|nr:MFS transporter [Pseudolabrys sp.]